MIDLGEFGPAMRALSEKQRAYVQAMAADPFGNPSRWAKAAGYADCGANTRVKGHLCAHDPKIQAAIFEYGQSMLGTMGPLLAAAGMIRIARNPKHKQHFKALEAIANRVGLHETTEHVVNVNHSDRTGAAMAERITQLAGVLGIDPGQLLGVNAAPMLIEGEVSREMEPGE